MNRSILIVMLDFIVLSLLSMITGLSTLENPYGNDGTVVNTKTAQVIADKLKDEKSLLEEAYLDLKEAQERFGYSQARSEAMQKIEAQLAATDIQLEILEKKDITNVDVKESQSLSNEAATLPSKYRSAMSQIPGTKSSSSASDGNILDAFNFGEPGNLDLNALQNTTKTALGFTTEDKESELEIKLNSEEVRRLQNLLSQKETELAAVQKNLEVTQENVKNLIAERAALQQENQQQEQQITQLNETVFRKDKVIVENTRRIRNAQNVIEQKKREVNVRVEEVKKVQNTLVRAIKDMSQYRAAAETAKQEAEDVKVELDTVRQDFKYLRQRIEGNVLDYYDQTVQNIRIYMEQERFFANKRRTQNLFLPVVRVENKPVVISLFRLLCANDMQEEFEVNDVLNYTCKAYTPDGSDPNGEKINGYLTVPRKDIRVGCLELDGYIGKTLSFLTFSDIKRRGQKDLYLFKVDSFGRDGGTLEGRCSLSLRKNDAYLYIRNALETSSEAKAEEGDLVMTKEGGFVGIVVSVMKFENGTSEAKCFIFPDNFRMRNSIRINIDKSSKDKYITDFNDKIPSILQQLETLEQTW